MCIECIWDRIRVRSAHNRRGCTILSGAMTNNNIFRNSHQKVLFPADRFDSNRLFFLENAVEDNDERCSKSDYINLRVALWLGKCSVDSTLMHHAGRPFQLVCQTAAHKRSSLKHNNLSALAPFD